MGSFRVILNLLFDVYIYKEGMDFRGEVEQHSIHRNPTCCLNHYVTRHTLVYMYVFSGRNILCRSFNTSLRQSRAGGNYTGVWGPTPVWRPVPAEPLMALMAPATHHQGHNRNMFQTENNNTFESHYLHLASPCLPHFPSQPLSDTSTFKPHVFKSSF